MWVYLSTCNDLFINDYEYEKKINYKLAYLVHGLWHVHDIVRGYADPR